ncbi:MAG: hypothetical protein WCR52_00680 [Bacteroidota bacterium]
MKKENSEIEKVSIGSSGINYFVPKNQLKYVTSEECSSFVYDAFKKELNRLHPDKYKVWDLFIMPVVTDLIDTDYKVMGPSRDTRNKVESFGLHINCNAYQNEDKPLERFFELLFDAFEELYVDKFKMPNPNINKLRSEALEFAKTQE